MAISPERHQGFSPRPAGFSRFVYFLTPFGVASRYVRHAWWLVVNLLFIRACGMLAGVTLVSLVSRISTRAPRVPECFGGFPYLPDALFGTRQKVISRASEDVSHLLETVGWNCGTALIQAQACLTTTQAFCELLLSHADAASLRCDVIHRFNLLSN